MGQMPHDGQNGLSLRQLIEIAGDAEIMQP
jgi:hypothetical protein